MIRKVFESMFNLFTWYAAPREVKENCRTTLSKLRSIPKTGSSKVRVLDSKSGSGKVSLFESMPRTTSPERSLIGHWCTLSAAAAREERLSKIERSYEGDFRTAQGCEIMQLETYLSKNANHSALNRYINGEQYNRDASQPINASVSSDEATEFRQGGLDRNQAEPQTLYSEQDALYLKLAIDELDEIRISTASNVHAPIPAFWLLAEDNCQAVKLALVDNQTMPLNILEKLASDSDGRVARRAQTKLRKIANTEEGIAFGNLSATSAVTVDVYEYQAPEDEIAV